MPQYRISRAAKLMGVSSDTMRRWADAGRVRTSSDEAGHRSVDGADLARLATELAAERDRSPRSPAPAVGRADPDSPHARTGRPPGGAQSARNHVAGIVTRVTRDEVAALVELQAGPYRLVSLITREAADELALEPGMMATAVVKATNVSIELPSGD